MRCWLVAIFVGSAAAAAALHCAGTGASSPAREPVDITLLAPNDGGVPIALLAEPTPAKSAPPAPTKEAPQPAIAHWAESPACLEVTAKLTGCNDASAQELVMLQQMILTGFGALGSFGGGSLDETCAQLLVAVTMSGRAVSPCP